MAKNLGIILIIGCIAIIGNWVGYGVSPIQAAPGMLIILAVVLAGWGLNRVIPKIPIVIWIATIALIVTTPIFPGNAFIVSETGTINFMALATPILAYAGLSFGKDLEEFKKLSWKIVVISIVVYTGTFLIATIFAEVSFHLGGRL